MNKTFPKINDKFHSTIITHITPKISYTTFYP